MPVAVQVFDAQRRGDLGDARFEIGVPNRARTAVGASRVGARPARAEARHGCPRPRGSARRGRLRLRHCGRRCRQRRHRGLQRRSHGRIVLQLRRELDYRVRLCDITFHRDGGRSQHERDVRPRRGRVVEISRRHGLQLPFGGSLPDLTSCTDLNLKGIAVDGKSRSNSDDGLFVLTSSGSYGTMNLLDATSRAVPPASC